MTNYRLMQYSSISLMNIDVSPVEYSDSKTKAFEIGKKVSGKKSIGKKVSLLSRKKSIRKKSISFNQIRL